MNENPHEATTHDVFNEDADGTTFGCVAKT